LGIPAYTLRDTRLDVFQFADTELSTAVRRGVQALAVDERRADFTPTLWKDDRRIMQTLFPGCHSDVGGGFVGPGPESGLSDCALQWMIELLQPLGITFLTTPAYVPQPDPRATCHAPWLTGVWRDLPQGPREFPPGLYLSEEVVNRAEAPAVSPDPSMPMGPYTPGSLHDYLEAGAPAEGVTVV
jgi:hypothetical protein